MINKIFNSFTPTEWASLQHNISTSLTENDIANIEGINERLSQREIHDIYLPLLCLINSLHKSKNSNQTFIIGLCGSVSVGKTTIARLLKFLLEQHHGSSSVDIISTDNFLYPLEHLTQHNLLERKGFPESYDTHAMLKCISSLYHTGTSSCPIYSHILYDVEPNSTLRMNKPKFAIVEGLNTLQKHNQNKTLQEFFDISFYIDAPEKYIKDWYIERFLTFKREVFLEKSNYFHHYSKLTHEEAVSTASHIWDSINGYNLQKFIEPTKHRANIILQKGQDHFVDKILVDNQTQTDIRRCMTNHNTINFQ